MPYSLLMTSSHANCDHEFTKAARATCRKVRAEAANERNTWIDALLAAMPENDLGIDWLVRGAQNFSDYRGDNRIEAANALLDYFAPSGDEARDASRRRNGYVITTDAYRIRSIILTRNS